jgi:outer membrane protein OmpA-like peptidoglycan-associated protein
MVLYHKRLVEGLFGGSRLKKIYPVPRQLQNYHRLMGKDRGNPRKSGGGQRAQRVNLPGLPLQRRQETMAFSYLKATGQLASSLLVGGLIWTTTGAPAAAQAVVPSDQILNALTPPQPQKPALSAPFLTRSLTAPAVTAPAVTAPASDPDSTFIEGLRHRTRSLTLDEADHVAEIAKDRAKIDLEINFDFNASAITAKAEPQLKELGTALKSAQLKNSVIVISGHTDAKGSDEYNQKLSERRAEAIKAFLVEKMKISPDNLTTAGYGKRNLKNKANPFAAENRRVEVVNMNATNQARR